MSATQVNDRRLRVATEAYDLIETEVRPLIASGGRLWSKGPGGYPSRFRQMLGGLDAAHDVSFATDAALALPPAQRVVEHVVPMKRIVIEIVDPTQADPRSNTCSDAIAGGRIPAAHEEHHAIHRDPHRI